MPKITLTKNVRKYLYWVALIGLVLAGGVGVAAPEESALAIEHAGSTMDLLTQFGDKLVAAVGIIVALRNLTDDADTEPVGEVADTPGL